MINSARRELAALLTVVVLLLLLVFAPLPASANPGMTVSGAVLAADVSPGATLTHKMTIGISQTDPTSEIAVRVTGMGQSLDGANEALETSGDTSSYSARQFITVDRESLYLESGDLQDVTATIQIPQDVGTGGRYAIINIQTRGAAGAAVNILAAVNVPIYLTIKDSQLEHKGEITAVTTSEPVSGQPIDIFTTFRNTGNHHFKIKGELTITNSRGKTLDTIQMPLAPSSIIPTMSRRLVATFIPKEELPSGVYSVKSRVMLDNGTILDEAEASFEIKQVHVPSAPTAPAGAPLPPPPPTAVPAGTNWPLIVGVGAGAGIIVFAVLFLLVRRRGY